jgi:pyruvate kinase
MSFAEFSQSESPSQRRAKIVATLGPASNTETVVRDLVRAGVDIVRLNFSHGTHERKLAVMKIIRKVSRDEHKPLCILGDLQGPKIRTALLKDHQPVLLKRTHHHHSARRSRHGLAGRHHLQDPCRKRRAGFAHPALRRPYRIARA